MRECCERRVNRAEEKNQSEQKRRERAKMNGRRPEIPELNDKKTLLVALPSPLYTRSPIPHHPHPSPTLHLSSQPLGRLPPPTPLAKQHQTAQARPPLRAVLSHRDVPRSCLHARPALRFHGFQRPTCAAPRPREACCAGGDAARWSLSFDKLWCGRFAAKGRS